MKSQNTSFCFLIPSRKRTKLLEQTIHKIIEKTYDLTKIEIILGIDSDDLETQKFSFSNLSEEKINIKKVVIDRKSGYEDQPQRLLEMIKVSNNDFFIHFADDMEIMSKNWDKIVRQKIQNLPILANDTNNVIEFNDTFDEEIKNDKKRNFWDLLKNR